MFRRTPFAAAGGELLVAQALAAAFQAALPGERGVLQFGSGQRPGRKRVAQAHHFVEPQALDGARPVAPERESDGEDGEAEGHGPVILGSDRAQGLTQVNLAVHRQPARDADRLARDEIRIVAGEK